MNPLSPAEWEALSLSLRVGVLSVIVSLPFALGLAWLLSRARFPGRILIEAALFLPLTLPPVVTGYALLVLFGRHGWIGEWLGQIGIVFAFRWTGAVLAACVMGFPLLVLSIRVAFDMVDRRLERAAETLGASTWRRFVTIVLPLSSRGIVAGGVLAFARAFGEFGATITFVSSIPGETRTLPIAIYELISLPGGEGGVQRLTLVALGVAFAATLVAALLGGTLWGRRQHD
ncbi:MAG: molybdate ABC transporter permease subunit [Dokdonella sp.]|uniref:molybdate ABC transporter permease subunit n=1 Tax=Dokdonella sp. TaxID=2291710 RepID=UPI002CC68E88|nr:molybdate ABC transporter permease subunit [Dokdonella sp.]HOX72699.1 molybdate ABC transporter permease subunit [Dokdonella sp.]HPG94492.1 molybdate ABC transporter permease subunit [Dokdonella sp.]HPN78635.1 molybdate ABC transporter permease subunit [Dokdonella sp.]